jgi:homoserine kinase
MARKRKQSPGANSFKLQLPATSANLGPAFDAAGLALEIFLTLQAQPAKGFAVTAIGIDSDICGQVENHLILRTYREVLEAEGKRVLPLELRIENAIPIGKGCGSSAAARLAGIALAVHYGKLRWNDDRIVGEASRREHHPDNAAACWMGGLAVARMASANEAQVAVIQPKQRWPLILAIPGQALSTEQARKVLPDLYPRADVVSNLQNAMLLLAALSQGRPDLLASALHDRIHEPYRASLCPLLLALQELRGHAGILGVTLSGAGPSVLVFVDPKANVKKVKAAVEDQLRKKALSADLLITQISGKGAAKSNGWKKSRLLY